MICSVSSMMSGKIFLINSQFVFSVPPTIRKPNLFRISVLISRFLC